MSLKTAVTDIFYMVDEINYQSKFSIDVLGLITKKYQYDFRFNGRPFNHIKYDKNEVIFNENGNNAFLYRITSTSNHKKLEHEEIFSNANQRIKNFKIEHEKILKEDISVNFLKYHHQISKNYDHYTKKSSLYTYYSFFGNRFNSKNLDHFDWLAEMFSDPSLFLQNDYAWWNFYYRNSIQFALLGDESGPFEHFLKMMMINPDQKFKYDEIRLDKKFTVKQKQL